MNRLCKYKLKFLLFFFSSRRRHTRFDCDWSSDVCSSDLFKKLNLLIKIKIRKHLMKKVKLILAIQRLKKCLTFLAKINLPMIMKMKRDQPKTNRYITIQILILNRMIACLISGNYFDLFYF